MQTDPLPSKSVVLRMTPDEARTLHLAAGTTVSLMDQVGDVPAEAPLYGKRDELVRIARRLDHEINHAGFNPLGGASRGIGHCSCAAGPGTNPACPVHP